MKSGTLLIFFLLLFSGCNDNKQREDVRVDKPDITTIIIQPFADISPAIVDSVYQRIKKINKNTILKEPISLPDIAYNPSRGRYRADSLIDCLWKRSTKNSVVIGLTSKDISANKGDIQDWGVMGLAYCPGHSCVVSTFRLSKNNVYEQFYKIAIHELGHTQGLDHCKNDISCFMRDAEGKNHTDELSKFCNFCKAHLEKKGWELE